jgi:hypothetical protein
MTAGAPMLSRDGLLSARTLAADQPIGAGSTGPSTVDRSGPGSTNPARPLAVQRATGDSQAPRRLGLGAPLSVPPFSAPAVTPLLATHPSDHDLGDFAGSGPHEVSKIMESSRDQGELSGSGPQQLSLITEQRPLLGERVPLGRTAAAPAARSATAAPLATAAPTVQRATAAMAAMATPMTPATVARLMAAQQPAAPPLAVAAPQPPVVQRTEAAPAPEPLPEPVVQTVTVQRVEAPAAHPVPAPGAPAPEELLAGLFDPLLRRLRTELRIERDRRGALTDLRH